MSLSVNTRKHVVAMRTEFYHKWDYYYGLLPWLWASHKVPGHAGGVTPWEEVMGWVDSVTCLQKASASHCQNSAGSTSHGWLPWLFCRAHPSLSVGVAAWAALLTQSCAQTPAEDAHKEALLLLDRTYKLPGNNHRSVPWTNPVCEEKQQETKSRSQQGVLRSLTLPCWVMGTQVAPDIEAGAHISIVTFSYCNSSSSISNSPAPLLPPLPPVLS